MSKLFSTDRRACVSLPLSSVRHASDWGVGDIHGLQRFCTWAGQAGFQLVQILPFHEIWAGDASPYSSLTAFALDPVYLALPDCEDFLAAGGEGALDAAHRDALEYCRSLPTVDWKTVRTLKNAALRLSYQRFVSAELAHESERARSFQAFAQSCGPWLNDHALYMAIAQTDGPDWMGWPTALRNREPETLAAAARRHADEIGFRQYAEWQLSEQWQRMRTAARSDGTDVAGDLPFVVSRSSSDVWARQQDFRLDLRLGTPPDAFSAHGQDWGLPVYNWDTVAAGGFAWMRARAERASELCSVWRVDHVIGLYRSYFRSDEGDSGFTPAAEEAQIRLGEATLAVLGGAGEILAEDLGMVPTYLRPSLKRLAIPGYRVLRWEREDDGPFHDPAAWPAVSVATSGTHDTEGLADWYDALSERDHTHLARVPGLESIAAAHRVFDSGVRDALLGAVYNSGSALAILPFFDLMGTRERVNVPGSVSDANWTCRVARTVAELEADHASTDRIRGLAQRSGRLGP